MYLMTFKEFARKLLKQNIIQTIKYLKDIKKENKNYKNDNFYKYSLQVLKNLYKNRQSNNFKEYKRFYDYYKNYINFFDIKKGLTIKECNKILMENYKNE